MNTDTPVFLIVLASFTCISLAIIAARAIYFIVYELCDRRNPAAAEEIQLREFAA